MTTPELAAAERDVVWAACTAAEGTVDTIEPADRAGGCARCDHATAVMTPVGR